MLPRAYASCDMAADALLPLTISLIQGETRWHDAAANRAYYGDLVRSVGAGSDLVILPETFLSGFTNDTLANAEDMGGESLEWMRALAAETGTVITGSLIIGVGGQCFNRLIWMRPDRSHASYDKRHLFRMAAEHERYAAGEGRLIVELKGWRICPQVCYDLSVAGLITTCCCSLRTGRARAGLHGGRCCAHAQSRISVTAPASTGSGSMATASPTQVTVPCWIFSASRWSRRANANRCSRSLSMQKRSPGIARASPPGWMPTRSISSSDTMVQSVRQEPMIFRVSL